jgi:hypothetical protein
VRQGAGVPKVILAHLSNLTGGTQLNKKTIPKKPIPKTASLQDIQFLGDSFFVLGPANKQVIPVPKLELAYKNGRFTSADDVLQLLQVDVLEILDRTPYGKRLLLSAGLALSAIRSQADLHVSLLRVMQRVHDAIMRSAHNTTDQPSISPNTKQVLSTFIGKMLQAFVQGVQQRECSWLTHSSAKKIVTCLGIAIPGILFTRNAGSLGYCSERVKWTGILEAYCSDFFEQIKDNYQGLYLPLASSSRSTVAPAPQPQANGSNAHGSASKDAASEGDKQAKQSQPETASAP